MTRLKEIFFALLLLFALLTTAAAQDSTTVQRSSLTITAAAAGERVRITAPASIVQMRVEVYGPGGEKLFDQEIPGGNVFDWRLLDAQGQRLAPGSYVCVVTARSTSGKLTRKIGRVTVAENSASAQPADASELSALQAQAIGPVEENSSWTIAAQDDPQTPTVIANDGADGQMIRGRGPLTFRIGNFFNGIDAEQMRLTEQGNLGIGTPKPQAKLEVAGAVYAERFLIAKPTLAATGKSAAGTQPTNTADSVQPLMWGTGLTGQLPKWTDGTTGGLGDSVITEAQSNIGIGTTNPTTNLHVFSNSAPVGIRLENAGAGVIAESRLRVAADSAISDFYNQSVAGGQYVQFQFQNNLGMYMNQVANAPLAFQTSNLERIRILGGGNVGIGTIYPTTNLHVFGNTDGPVGIRLENADTGVSAESNLRIAADAAISDLYVQSVAGGQTVQWQFQNNAGVYLNQMALAPIVFQTNNLERMRILATGSTSRVGIGTIGPNYNLDVFGDVNITGKYRVNGMAITPWTQVGNNLYYTTGNIGIGRISPGYKLDVSGDANISGTYRVNGIPLSFAPVWTQAGNDIYYTAGNVGIGAASPGAKLHVSGTIIAGGDLNLSPTNADGAAGVINQNGTPLIHSFGTNNFFAGAGAGNFTMTGVGNNTAIGAGALASNTTGTNNTASGTNALTSNTTGANNTASGTNALKNNTLGSNNSAFGLEALIRNTSGSGNTAGGREALWENTTGNYNTGIGDLALWVNTTGNYNTSIGAWALAQQVTGQQNTAIGYLALHGGYGRSGSINNTAIGSTTLRYAVDSNNIALGYGAGNDFETGENNIDIGLPDNDYGYRNAEANTIRIGFRTHHTRTFVAGIRAITTDVADAVPVLIDSDGQLGTVSSSRRYKEDIKDMGSASQRLFGLRPVTFRYQKPYANGEKPMQFGLIAEEVAETFPELVVRNQEGQPETVKYQDLTPLMLNELLKEHARGDAQAKTIAELQAQASSVSSGNVTTDQKGVAIVTLPDNFAVLNQDFRYQLAVVGPAAQAIVLEEVKGNQFKIKTDRPEVKVYWEVTGIRR